MRTNCTLTGQFEDFGKTVWEDIGFYEQMKFKKKTHHLTHSILNYNSFTHWDSCRLKRIHTHTWENGSDNNNEEDKPKTILNTSMWLVFLLVVVFGDGERIKVKNKTKQIYSCWFFFYQVCIIIGEYLYMKNIISLHIH